VADWEDLSNTGISGSFLKDDEFWGETFHKTRHRLKQGVVGMERGTSINKAQVRKEEDKDRVC